MIGEKLYYICLDKKSHFLKKINTIKKTTDEYELLTCHCIIHIINIDSNLVKKIKIVYIHMKKIFFFIYKVREIKGGRFKK